jgi:hypothetical protein
MCSEKQSSSSSSAVGMSVCLCYKSNTRDCEEMSIRSLPVITTVTAAQKLLQHLETKQQ